MDFVTIDFETATSERDSPCEVALTFVKDLQIVDSRSWLIKPMYEEFDDFNISIHGITPNDVKDQPEFNELWREIKPLIENQFLIAHNAAFDFSVLRRTLQSYELPFPKLDYSCSYIFSKKVWQGLPAYDLRTLCKFNDISFKHHRAQEDSMATAKLSLKAFGLSGILCKEDFPEKLKISIGHLFDGGYRPCESKRACAKGFTVVGDPSKHKPESMFYGKTVVFTGTLSSMKRTEAHQIIADIGGTIGNNVTNDTDFLIVGQQDYRVVGEEG